MEEAISRYRVTSRPVSTVKTASPKRHEPVDESMVASWREVFELEKKRFSFFDELFALGYVVDSMEVPKSSEKSDSGEKNEFVESFVEAEDSDFRNKIDYGRIVLKTKHVFTGNLLDWYFQGPGRYVWIDGTVFQGDFLHGVMNGIGTLHWPDGSVYEGEFLLGRKTGWGVYSTAEGYTYAGDWLNGLPHGKGKMWYDPGDGEGDYYDGDWFQGTQTGFGTRQYSNGDRYFGQLYKSQRSGQGTMIWLQERQVYKGSWENGIPQGKGKHTWFLERSDNIISGFPTRHVYSGDWVEGRRHGVGKMIYPCGSIYEGSWKNGQRQGKGVFLNPAGDIIIGLFKGGGILGGNTVPLHSPTYEYDFGGLLEYLMTKFNLKIEDEFIEAENLSDTTIMFLTELRKLYARAGKFSQSWGEFGLFPCWMKSSYGQEGNSVPQHMRDNWEKPISPDGVNPVTRFGLWLLIKDCVGLTNDKTMAYFDKLFGDTPTISFQTRHNPFEPVYLWQFLQCLVVLAVAIYMDIPEEKRKIKLAKASKIQVEEFMDSEEEEDSPLDEDKENNGHKINSDSHKDSPRSIKQKHIPGQVQGQSQSHLKKGRTHSRLPTGDVSTERGHKVEVLTERGGHKGETSERGHKVEVLTERGGHKGETSERGHKVEVLTERGGHKGETSERGHKVDASNERGNKSGASKKVTKKSLLKAKSILETQPVNEVARLYNKSRSATRVDQKSNANVLEVTPPPPPITANDPATVEETLNGNYDDEEDDDDDSVTEEEDDDDEEDEEEDSLSPGEITSGETTSGEQRTKSINPKYYHGPNSSMASESGSTNTRPTMISLVTPISSVGSGIRQKKKKPIRTWDQVSLPHANLFRGWDLDKECSETVRKRSSDLFKVVKTEDEEPFTDLDLSASKSEQKEVKKYEMTISHAFEMFMMERLVPCLDNEPGKHLPVTPRPLPPLVDLFEAFQNISNQTKEYINGKEFIQSILPRGFLPTPAPPPTPLQKSEIQIISPPKVIVESNMEDEEILESLNLEEEQDHQEYPAHLKKKETHTKLQNVFGIIWKNSMKEETSSEKEEIRTENEAEIQTEKEEIPVVLPDLEKDDAISLSQKASSVILESNDKDDQFSLGSDFLGSLTNLDSSNKFINSAAATLKEETSDLDRRGSNDDYLTDAIPFSENDLLPEPFLWVDDSKMVKVPKSTMTYTNLKTDDVLKVLKFLYPNLIEESVENNFNFDFDMIFCDWLWGVCLCAKISADKDVYEALHPDLHRKTIRTSNGVEEQEEGGEEGTETNSVIGSYSYDADEEFGDETLAM